MNIRKFAGQFLILLIIMVVFVMSANAAVCTPAVSPNQLVFTAPSTNTDGTVLVDLAGFKLYYSNTSGIEGTGIIKDVAMDGVTGPGTTGAIMLSSLGLADGKTYYFKLSAYDTAGLESSLSTEAFCTFDATVPNSPSTIIVK
jgi:hypothetical protein